MNYIDKPSARAIAKSRRNSIPTKDRQWAAKKAAKSFLQNITLQKHFVISAYWPLPSELDCRPLIHALFNGGYRIALPAIALQKQSICFRRWQPGDGLAKSNLGVLEPLPNAEEIIPNVVITPFLAINSQGFRLGYGGGYYDRALRILRETAPDLLAVGLGYSAQEVATLPYDENDEPLDWLVTEQGTRRFQR